MVLLERCHEVSHLALRIAGSESMSFKKICRSIVNLRAFISPSLRHSPSRLATTVSCIESRDGDASVCPCSVTLTSECITASAALKKRTNFTSPLKPRAFYDRVEYPMMERGDLPATLQVRALERDETRFIGEGRCGGCGIARVPSVDHSLMDGADSVLVGGS
jgi:hypothetical protein